MGIRCADHVTPLYRQKLALTSPTGGGRSVGIVRSRTKATELVIICHERGKKEAFGNLGMIFAILAIGTVSVRVEYITKYTNHKFSLVVILL